MQVRRDSDGTKYVNTLAWVDQCRQRCHNSIQNTAVGAWLDEALGLVVEQHREIQDARNDSIDAAYVVAMMEMLRDEKWLVALKVMPPLRGFIIEGSRSEYDAPCPDKEVGHGKWVCEVSCMDSERKWPRRHQIAFGDSASEAVEKIIGLIRDEERIEEPERSEA